MNIRFSDMSASFLSVCGHANVDKYILSHIAFLFIYNYIRNKKKRFGNKQNWQSTIICIMFSKGQKQKKDLTTVQYILSAWDLLVAETAPISSV